VADVRIWIRTAAAAAAVLAFTGATAGCSGEPPRATVVAGTTGGSSAAEQQLARVPLNGTDEAPIYWDLAVNPDPTLADAVLAARRAQALEVVRESSVKPTGLAEVLPYVETPSLASADLLVWQQQVNTDPMVGPVWIRVIDVSRRSVDEVLVGLCVDLRWRHPRSTRVAGAPKLDHRVGILAAVVRRVGAPGPAQWLVDDLGTGAAGDMENRRGAECTSWATHSPPPTPQSP
jgi:hypothetical protein